MVINKLKMLTLAAMSATALGVAACSEGVPSANSPASIRTEPASAERVFQNNADTVTLIDVALVFAYLQIGADATPEAIIEAINSLTGETLTVADFDDPFPTFADAAGFIAPTDTVDLNDVAAFFAVLQGAEGEDAIAAAIAQLTGAAFDAADIVTLPGSGTTASPSPSPSPTAPPLPMPEPGETFTLFVDPDATAIGNGSEATPFATVAAADEFIDSIIDSENLTDVDFVISVINPGEEDVVSLVKAGGPRLASSLQLFVDPEDTGNSLTLISVDGFTLNIPTGNTVTVGRGTEVISTDFVVEEDSGLVIKGTFTGPSLVELTDAGSVSVSGEDTVVSATTFLPDNDSTASTLVSVSSTGEAIFNDVNIRTNEIAFSIGLFVVSSGTFTYTTGEVEVSTDTVGISTIAAGDVTIDGVDFTIAETDECDTVGVSTTSTSDSSSVTITNSTFSIADGSLGVDLSDGSHPNEVNNSAVIENSAFAGTSSSFAISLFEDEPGDNDALIEQYEEAGNTFTGFGLLGAIQQETP